MCLGNLGGLVEWVWFVDVDVFVGFRQVEVFMVVGGVVYQLVVVLDIEGKIDDYGFDFVQVVDQIVMFVGCGFQYDDFFVLLFVWVGFCDQ